MSDVERPSPDEQMSLAIKAMAHHAAQSEHVNRTGWTDAQWCEDAERLMDDIDGSVMSLVNGHVLALIAERKRLAEYVSTARAEALREAADKWQTGDWAAAPRRPDRIQERIANAQYVTDWLRERAARIAREEPT